ncbi:hypothetical protein AALA00_13550 [Lachnospiraceae bacterium 46-15]
MEINSFEKWVKAAGVRGVKTVAQAAVAGIGTAAVMGQATLTTTADKKEITNSVNEHTPFPLPDWV